MADAEVEVRNPSGLHARPAASFVRAYSAFAADVLVSNLTRDAARTASAKSVLGPDTHAQLVELRPHGFGDVGARG